MPIQNANLSFECVIEKDLQVFVFSLFLLQHEHYRDNLYAIAVSAYPAAGMIGSLLVGPVVKRFGRYVVLLIKLFKVDHFSFV